MVINDFQHGFQFSEITERITFNPLSSSELLSVPLSIRRWGFYLWYRSIS